MIDKIYNALTCVLLILGISLCVIGTFHRVAKNAETAIVIEVYDNGPETLVTSPKTGDAFEISDDVEELPDEPELSAQAIYETIGTPDMIEAFGFDFLEFCEIVYEEGGAESDALIRALVTCAMNTCIEYDNRITLLEATKVNKWVASKGVTSQRVIDICFDVVIRGNINVDVDNATMFYNPTVNGENYEHEVQRYITTIDNVKFFEEVKK